MTKPKRKITKIACIGEVMIELVANSETTAVGVAGDTYNTAVYLRRLLPETFKVSYITALGTDKFSDRIFDQLKAHKIDATHIEKRPAKVPGLYAIDTDNEGERTFTYWRSDSAARTLFSEPCDVSLNTLNEFDLILTSGISLAILPPDIRLAFIAALAQFSAAGGWVVYDSNYRPHLWNSQKEAQEINTLMWGSTDIAITSVDDEMAIFNETSETQTLARLAAFGFATGALKRGAKGPIGLANPVLETNLPPITKAVDTTAAGDSFNAGFLSEFVQEKPLIDALTTGHSIASKVIQKRGAIVDF